MKFDVKPGKYIVAVSGGVDSVVLLDLLSNLRDLDLIVAHFDHGIRADSKEDAGFVSTLAQKYDLPFELGRAELGPNASEDQARQARYDFLDSVSKKHKADAIITAHHQDDIIETALINVIRGSGRRGLTAILDNKKVLRPLSKVSKKDILEYAQTHNLKWREDSTNNDSKYLRNRLRRMLAQKLTKTQKDLIVKTIEAALKNNKETNKLLAVLSADIKKGNKIDRQKFIALPHDLSNELISYWLRQYQVSDVDKKTIERLSLAVKTAAAGTKQPIKKNLSLDIGVNFVQFNNSL